MTAPVVAGYMLYDEETTIRTLAGPTKSMFVSARQQQSMPDIIRRQYFTGTRFGETGVQKGKFASTLQATYPVFPNVGVMYYKHALGKAVYLTALTSDTTTGTATTTNGLTSMTLTTGAAYTIGAFVQVGTGASLELGRVVSYASGPKTLVVSGLSINTTAVTGTAVQQVGQHKFSPLLASDTGYTTLPTSSVEVNVGGAFSWQRLGCFVNQLTITGDKSDATSQLHLVPTAMPTRPGSATAWAPTATEAGDQDQFFTINNGHLVLQQDIGGSAVNGSIQQVAASLDTWKLDIQNTIVEKEFWDGQQHKRAFPTVGKALFDYSFLEEAKRNELFEDYIASTNNPAFAAFINLIKNVGTATTPVWNAWGAYMPSTEYISAPEVENLADMVSVTASCECVRPTNGDALQIFVCNSKATSY